VNNIHNPNVKNANSIHGSQNFVLVDKNYGEICGPDLDHSLLPWPKVLLHLSGQQRSYTLLRTQMIFT
jgi:hypothetical protein